MAPPRGLAGATALVALAVALPFGALPFGIVAAAVGVAAYVELRTALDGPRSPEATALGAAAVASLAWFGYDGRLERLAWVVAGLLLALLVLRLLLAETGRRTPEGASAEAAATLAAAGIVGVLGAHVLLLRSLPRTGFRGVVAFGTLALAAGVVSAVVSRRLRSPPGNRARRGLPWQGSAAGMGASAGVGALLGLVLDPPLGPLSGAMMGAGMGVLVAVGDLAGTALVERRGLREATRGPLDGLVGALAGPLFAAPFFYWAYRTLVI